MIGLLKKKQPRSIDFGKGTLSTFLNPYSYLIMRKNFQLVDSFDQVFFDGILLAWLMRLAGSEGKRVSFDMTSLAPKVFRHACHARSRVFIIGSEPGVAMDATTEIMKKYPELLVCGVRHGYFSSNNERSGIIKELVNIDPDIVIVGMGTPLQENFLVDLRSAGWAKAGYTCGGFLHQTAKKGVRYYPLWVDRFNLRWLYRMIDEPKLVRRYFIDYPKFIFVFFYDLGRYYLKK